jgi:hypothetical protein
MKKVYMLISFTLFAFLAFSQDTITGWTFPANSGADSLNANLGTSQNQTYDLRFQMFLTATTDSTINSVYFVDGSSTYAAATAGWNNGADSKFWSIKFKASTYKDFKVSSKQKSDAGFPGPKDFKLQWRLSNGTYADVPGGTITVGTDWTSGMVTDLPVPITNQGTGSIYIRWIMTTNLNTSGETVTSAGISAIDDIVVTAVSTLGTNDIVYTNRVNVYPTPNQGLFHVDFLQKPESVSIISMTGETVYRDFSPGMQNRIDLQNKAKGIYFLRVKFADNDSFYTSKIIIE